MFVLFGKDEMHLMGVIYQFRDLSVVSTACNGMIFIEKNDFHENEVLD